jgi:hypothetical protein
MSDEAELQRLHAPYSAAGLGEPVYMDDDSANMLQDFGLNFGTNEGR